MGGPKVLARAIALTALVGIALPERALVSDGPRLAFREVQGCSGAVHVHETDEGRSSPCIRCHEAAFAAAVRPKHDEVFENTCEDCHTQQSWRVPALHELPAVVPTPCVQCHRAVYDATTAPKHEGMFPVDCKDCHAVKAWRPLERDIHDSETVKNGKCFSCHETQYKATTNPKHAGAFPTTCGDCHNTSAWKPAGTSASPTDAGAP